MSDSGAVHSYASAGLRLWAQYDTSHGPRCPDLICADVRTYLGWPPLAPDRAALFGVTLVQTFGREEAST